MDRADRPAAAGEPDARPDGDRPRLPDPARGGRAVVLVLAEAFPDAPIHTSFYDPSGTFPEFAGRDVHTQPINRIAVLRGHPRAAFRSSPRRSPGSGSTPR